MSFEVQAEAGEPLGQWIVKLLQEIEMANIRARESRRHFREITSSAQHILGNREILDVQQRIQTLGAVVLEKGLAELALKTVQDTNRGVLSDILMPKDKPHPLITVTRLIPGAIERNFQSPKRAPEENILTVTGTVINLGEHSVSVLNEEDMYLVYPTDSKTGDSQISIEVLTQEEADVRAA